MTTPSPWNFGSKWPTHSWRLRVLTRFALHCSASTVRDRKRSSITLNKNSAGAFQRVIHQGSIYAAPNFLKMGIKMPRGVVFLDDFDNEGRTVCCKVSLYKNCQRQSCRAFNCLSSGINILAGRRPLPPEILPSSDLPSPVNGILWEMSKLITQARIAVGSSNLVEGLTTWPAMYDRWPKSKCQRSRSQGHVTYQQQ